MPHDDARSTVLGTAAALTALFGVGSSLALLETIDDYPAAGGQAVRYALAAVLLAVVVRGRRIPRPNARQLGLLALLAATGLAGFNLLVIAAERSMDPASVGVVVATVPIVLAIAAPLQERRRVRPRVLLAAAIVALGAAAVQGVGGEVTVAGLAAALGALLGEAAFSLRSGCRPGARRSPSPSCWSTGSWSTGRVASCACRSSTRRWCSSTSAPSSRPAASCSGTPACGCSASSAPAC
jgi:drug/metabolite transporter (DMT)-like permease